jgi:hypothetical protein
MMEIQSLLKKLNTPVGRIIISVLLGLGLASIFRNSCYSKKECIAFTAPKMSDIENQVYKFNDKCYTFHLTSRTCMKPPKEQIKFHLNENESEM